jgi:glyoxylase-like metal-dependent hydrolase (beta-lactamase superfamily II)
MSEPAHPADLLPTWVTWLQRPFPDANLLLVRGRDAALVDSGFVGHAKDTADWARTQAPDLALVVNTHWHSDHVGGNALLQRSGVAVAASTPDADAVNRRDPGCCVAEYLDQPVAPYTVDRALSDGEVVRRATPPATSPSGNPSSASSPSATPSPTTTSAGSTSPWTVRTRPPRRSPPSNGSSISPLG